MYDEQGKACEWPECSRRSSMNPCLHMYSLGFTAGGTLRALRETSPPTKTHAAPALLARRMTYSTHDTLDDHLGYGSDGSDDHLGYGSDSGSGW